MRADTDVAFLLNLAGQPKHDTLPPSHRDDTAWATLLEQAAFHGLTVPLYRWALDQPRQPAMPLPLFRRLKAEVFAQRARNLLLTEELIAILAALEARSLDGVPLRGPVLAEQLYEDVTARPMGDLDLLVRKEQMGQVAESLARLGYREMDRRPGFAQAFWYTSKFIKDHHGWVVVEPHWTIAYPPFADRLDMDAVWNRTGRTEILGLATRLLHPTDLCLHLCFHMKHRGDTAPLLWATELERLLRRHADELDWPEFVRVALATGQEDALLACLNDLIARFDSPVPPDVMRDLQPRPLAAGEGIGRLERRLSRMTAQGRSIDGLESLALLLTLT
ncbi:MAG: nucleotidyltransferase domain-containing protein, partial [Nitrospirales bacterium]